MAIHRSCATLDVQPRNHGCCEDAAQNQCIAAFIALRFFATFVDVPFALHTQ